MSVDPKVDDIDPEAPLDPAVERVRAKLARLMGVSITIMLVSIMAVLGTIVYKVSDSEDASEPAQVENASGLLDGTLPANIAIPAGAQVLSHSYNDSVLSLHLRLSDGQQIIRLVELARNGQTRDIVLVSE